jgi:hypothetical protein
MLPAAPGSGAATKLKPGIGGYLAGGAILGAAIVVAVVLVILAVFDLFSSLDDLDRLPLDEATEVEVDIGTYDVYLVGGGVDASTSFGADDLLITDPDGDPRPVVVRDDPPLATPEDVYAPRLTFDAPTDGTYTFAPGPDADRSTEIDALAIGPEAESLYEDLLPWFIAAGSVALIGGTIGTVLLIVTGVRRGKAKRAVRGWPAGPGGPGAPVEPSQPLYDPADVVEGSWASSTPSVANAPAAPQPAGPSPNPPPAAAPAPVPTTPAPPAAAPPPDPWRTPGGDEPNTPWGAPPGSSGTG